MLYPVFTTSSFCSVNDGKIFKKSHLKLFTEDELVCLVYFRLCQYFSTFHTNGYEPGTSIFRKHFRSNGTRHHKAVSFDLSFAPIVFFAKEKNAYAFPPPSSFPADKGAQNLPKLLPGFGAHNVIDEKLMNCGTASVKAVNYDAFCV